MLFVMRVHDLRVACIEVWPELLDRGQKIGFTDVALYSVDQNTLIEKRRVGYAEILYFWTVWLLSFSRTFILENLTWPWSSPDNAEVVLFIDLQGRIQDSRSQE